MSDRNYDIDDILKEVDNFRENDKPAYDGSVTDIIGGNDLDKLLYAGSQRSRAPRAGRSKSAKKPDLSVTQVINEFSDKRENLSARQMTEEESQQRRAEDIRKAAEKKNPLHIFEETEEIKLREDVRPQEELPRPARQLTEDESRARLAKEISDAADVKLYEKAVSERKSPQREPVSVFTQEPVFSVSDTNTLDSFNDKYRASFADTGDFVKPESEYVKPFRKPVISGADDDIIFHTRGDLVTTETMEMRKQQRIEEINQALLKADIEAQSPDEMLDMINPAASREKVADMLRSEDDITDTLAVAGNDLKKIGHGEERVREYKPAAKRREPSADDVLFTPGKQSSKGELHVGESIIDALNKKIAEQQQRRPLRHYRSEFPTDSLGSTGSGRIIVPDAAEEVTADIPQDDEAVERVRRANELQKKKKRKIADFILDDIANEDEEDEAPEEASVSKTGDELIDLDDENVIKDRLGRAFKGLLGRIIILGVLFAAVLVLALANTFAYSDPLHVDAMGGAIFCYRHNAGNYLYAMLTVAILSFAACSSVVANGFTKLFKLRPDGDTLCALAHTTSCAGIVFQILPSEHEYTALGYSHIYLCVSLALLCFNTLSKLITVTTARKNFEFISSDEPKYYAEISEKGAAEQLAKGAVMGIPVLSSMRKTEMRTDFIVSTYCEDASDRISGKIVIGALAAAFIGAAAAFFTCHDESALNKLSWAMTVFPAVFCTAAMFSGSMTVTVPIFCAMKKGRKEKFALLGYEAAERFGEANAVALEASAIFPPSAVSLNNVCGYDRPATRGEGKINIDEAIILGTSLSVAAGSVLSDVLFNMLDNKKEMLKPVSGIVYENNLGVMGWIDRRRVLLGTREHMKSHEISVPSQKKEQAANPGGDSVIYLAVGGEVCLIFFVELKADPKIKADINRLTSSGVSLVIKAVDGMITSESTAAIFGIEEEKVKIISFDCHETFNETTKFSSSGPAGLSLDGSFSSHARGLCCAKGVKSRVFIGCMAQMGFAALGILLIIIFAVFGGADIMSKVFDPLAILLYNLAASAVTLALGFIKRL